MEKIAALLAAQLPQQSVLEEQVKRLKMEVETAEQEGDYFQLLSKSSLKLQASVSEIVREHSLDDQSSTSPLLDAIQYYQRTGVNLERTAPLGFLSANEQAAVINEAGKFQISLYKVLLFAQIAEGIKGGKINLIHSHKYRSLDDYLIPQVTWEQQREELLQEASLETFNDSVGTLKNLSLSLDQQHRRTNRHPPLVR